MFFIIIVIVCLEPMPVVTRPYIHCFVSCLGAEGLVPRCGCTRMNTALIADADILTLKGQVKSALQIVLFITDPFYTYSIIKRLKLIIFIKFSVHQFLGHPNINTTTNIKNK